MVKAIVFLACMASIIHALNVVYWFCNLCHDTWILDSEAGGHRSLTQTILHDLCLLDNSIMLNPPYSAEVEVTH